MKKSLLISIAALAISAPSVFAKGGKPALGTEHNPPRFVDESTTWVGLLNAGADDGYRFQHEAWVYGYTPGDRFHADWKQGGKVLTSVKCKINQGDHGTTYAHIHCDTANNAKPLKASGAVEVELIYEDDKEDKEYLLRTYKLTVNRWMKNTWQIAPDDLLGAAYVSHGNAGQDRHVPIFRFWIATKPNGFVGTLRCTANGTKLADIGGSVESRDGDIEADLLPDKGERTTWHWLHQEFIPRDLHWGTRDNHGENWMIEHPGKWDCQLRRDGVVVRQFLFTVDAQGMIESHPMQQAKTAALLADDVALIDIRIPKDAGFDQRIKPELLKKSRGFGLPWPDDPSVKAIHAAFPPAVETNNPRPPASAKGSGKTLAGADHAPARFVDESTTELAVRGNSKKGYQFRVYAVVTGYTSGTDKFRVEWKQAGKLVATAGCRWFTDPAQMQISGIKAGDNDVAEVSCLYDEKPLTTKGAIDAQLVLHDDQDGNDYLIRSYKVTVAQWTSFGDAVWGVVPDDVLAAGYVRHQESGDMYRQQPHFLFWVAHDEHGFDMNLRCTVDGVKLEDMKLVNNKSPGGLQLEEIQRTQSGKNTRYTWTHVDAYPDILWGSKDVAGPSETERAKFKWLIDHPGKWDCMVREQGKAIRQLLFTVNTKGMIDQDPMQAGKGAVPMLPNVSVIDLRIPKDSTYDERVRPDAMRRSRGFGLPWPEAANVKAIHGSMPAASGLPDPK